MSSGPAPGHKTCWVFSKISLTIIFLSTWHHFVLRRCWALDEICLGWHCSGIVACPHRDRQPWAVVPKALPAIPPLPSLPQPLLASADSEFQRKRHRLTISVSCLCNSVRGRPPPPVVFAGNAGGLKHRSTPSPVSSQCFDLRQPATLCPHSSSPRWLAILHAMHTLSVSKGHKLSHGCFTCTATASGIASRRVRPKIVSPQGATCHV